MRILFSFLWCTATFQVWAQTDKFKYRHSFEVQDTGWHRLLIPEDVFAEGKEMNSMRVYQEADTSLTRELPYVLRNSAPVTQGYDKKVRIINTAYNPEGYFAELLLDDNSVIEKIQLDFEQKNFDWKINVKGSRDGKQWFTLLENYRITSIANNEASFTFSELSFAPASFKHFQLFIPGNDKPVLNNATVDYYQQKEGEYKVIANTLRREEDKERKHSIIHLQLNAAQPITGVAVFAADDNFIRRLNIETIRDSAKTEKGWLYYYNNWQNSVLRSGAPSRFNGDVVVTSGIRLVIVNEDDAPLKIDSVLVYGISYYAYINVREPGKYYLYYGNSTLNTPLYDIRHQLDAIPENVATITAAGRENIAQEKLVKPPFFESTVWIWVAIAVVVLILGWFSIKMLTNADKKTN